MLSQIARCARFEGALERLDCFDRIARAHQVDGPQPRPGDGLDVGAWKVSEKINPLDDTRTINLILEASSGQTSMGRTPTLVLRCQSGEVNVYVVWADYLGSEAVVTWRVGGTAAQSRQWSLSTDSMATFYPGDARRFTVDELLPATQFVAQVTPYNESPVTAVFDLLRTQHCH